MNNKLGLTTMIAVFGTMLICGTMNLAQEPIGIKESKDLAARASAEIVNKDYETAFKDLNEAIRLNPKNAWAYALMGNYYSARKDYQNALVSQTKALEIAPGYAAVFFSRTYSYINLLKWDEAFSDINNALKFGYKPSECYALRGYINYQLKRPQEEIADYRKALEIDPNFENAKSNLKGALDRQKSQPAADAGEAYQKSNSILKVSDSKNGRFTSGDGAEIYYEIYGADKPGMPLIVLHGGPGFDHQYFLSNSAFTRLAKNRPVVFYDQRGTGKSSKVSGKQQATFDNSINDLENLRKQLGYEKINVAGHSFGGLLVMSYAAILPERVAHLILIDSVPAKYADDYSTFEKDYPQEFAEMQAKRLEGLKNKDDQAMRASIVAYMKMLFYSTKNRDAFIAGSSAYTYDAVVNYTVNKSADDVNVMPLMAKLTMPTLILHGRHDANITLDSSELIHKAIPQSQFVIFEQSGHMPFYEEEEKFFGAVENFLSK